MNDLLTKTPLRVLTNREGRAYMKVSVEQAKVVRKLLEENGVNRFWVEENGISINGGPYMTVIYFELRNDPEAIQRLLDENS